MSWNNFDYILIYIAMPMSRSSALSVNVMVMFEMHDLNGALFLNAIFF